MFQPPARCNLLCSFLTSGLKTSAQTRPRWEVHHLGSQTISLLGHSCAPEPRWPLCTVAHWPLLSLPEHIPKGSSLFYRRVHQISEKSCSSRNPTGSVVRSEFQSNIYSWAPGQISSVLWASILPSVKWGSKHPTSFMKHERLWTSFLFKDRKDPLRAHPQGPFLSLIWQNVYLSTTGPFHYH